GLLGRRSLGPDGAGLASRLSLALFAGTRDRLDPGLGPADRRRRGTDPASGPPSDLRHALVAPDPVRAGPARTTRAGTAGREPGRMLADPRRADPRRRVVRALPGDRPGVDGPTDRIRRGLPGFGRIRRTADRAHGWADADARLRDLLRVRAGRRSRTRAA